MLRVRIDGWVVPRHGTGQQRAVRGFLLVKDEHVTELNRSSRVAFFVCDDGQRLRLFDAALMHASAERLVLSGFERNENDMKTVDYAQTWVLKECHGEAPHGDMGPPYAR
jgi:hypothetical protein